MSYTIEYNKQFIRSGLGITPCWLAGDNNVYVSDSRRARSWCVFHNLLCSSEEAIMASIEPSLHGYDQHWKKGGHWVNDAGLIRWVKTGCEKAATVEEILEVNPTIGSIRCELSLWDKDLNQTKEILRWVRTTAEFDDWAREALAEMAAARAQGRAAYPIVDFGSERVRHPKGAAFAEQNKQVLLRRGRMYLSAIFPGRSSEWTQDVRAAKEMSYEEALRLMSSEKYGWLSEAVIVSSDIKHQPFNYVLKVEGGIRDGCYIERWTGKTVYFSKTEKYARHYPNRQSAERAAKGINAKFARWQVEVVELEETKKEEEK